MYSLSAAQSLPLGPGRLTPSNSLQSSTIAAPPSPRHRQTAASCLLCRRRKVKCDREHPCGKCIRAGEECVQFMPSRRPRGRQGGRKNRTADGELLERIARLEGFMRDVKGHAGFLAPSQTTGPPAASESSSVAKVDRSKAPLDGLDQFLAASFWSTMSEEINGLKDVMEGASNDEDEGDAEFTSTLDRSSSGLEQQPSHSALVLCQATSMNILICPTLPQRHQLCHIYLARVDPVLKILHGPSVRRYLQEDVAELDCSPGRNGLEALRYAIYFAAIATMEDNECRNLIGEEKLFLLPRYRGATESALTKTDFVNTLEMSTLQALTIYLTAVRVNDNSRFTWTLVSLAVRTAQAMGLHLEATLQALQPFEREMRRRLWWQICALDSNAAEDRASSLVLTAESFNTKMPLCINDDDIRFGSSEEVRERETFTEMTFCLICHEIFDTVRQLNYVPARDFGRLRYECQEEKWRKRIDMVVEVQRRIQDKYLRHLNLAHPLQWTTRMVADLITATLWLLVYRPLQRSPDVSMPQIADPGILCLSVDVLEQAHRLYTDPSASSFSWLSQIHVQWHAIAVVAAELCVKTEGTIVDRAWIILEPMFSESAKYVADSDSGMLWRPIKKLMNRARGVRRHYLDSQSLTNHARAAAPTSNVSNHMRTPHMSANGCETMVPFTPDQQQTVDSSALSTEGLQEDLAALPSAPFDWDPWLASATTNEFQQPSDLELTAWTNWEEFIDQFQGEGEAINYTRGC